MADVRIDDASWPDAVDVFVGGRLLLSVYDDEVLLHDDGAATVATLQKVLKTVMQRYDRPAKVVVADTRDSPELRALSGAPSWCQEHLGAVPDARTSRVLRRYRAVADYVIVCADAQALRMRLGLPRLAWAVWEIPRDVVMQYPT